MKSRYFFCVHAIVFLSVFPAFADDATPIASTSADATSKDQEIASEASSGSAETLEAHAVEAIPPRKSSDSSCADVTCSNHGNCVLLNGQPSCACDDGYAADSVNGLSCILASPESTVALQAPVASDISRVEADSSVKAVSALLPGYPTDRMYQRYLWLSKVGRFSGSFPDFVIERFKKKKIHGLVLVGTGVIVSALSVTSFAFGIVQNNRMRDDDPDCEAWDVNHESYDACQSRRNLLYISGGVTATASVTLYVVGGIMLGRASSRLRLIQRLKETTKKRWSRTHQITFSPLWNREHNIHGIAARILF
jgi:hypothetical protein